MMFKRLIDIIGALIGLVVLLPLFLILWGAAKLSSSQYKFGYSKRIGRNEKPIYIYRFKVRRNIKNIKKSTFTRQMDSLLQMLLYFKIDKYPMLLNVLKGDLSLVGTKPERPEYLKYYTEEQKQIFRVRPGLWRPDNYLNNLLDDETYRHSGGQIHNDYVKYILPIKIKEELNYIQNKHFGRDFEVFFHSSKMKLHRMFYQLLNGDTEGHNWLLPLDILLLSAAYLLAFQLRFDWNIPPDEWQIFLRGLPLVLLIRIGAFYYFGIYKNLWKYANISDLVRIISACTVSGLLIVAVFSLIGISAHSRSVFLIDWILSISLIGGIRMIFRFFEETFRVPPRNLTRVLILGTGEVGMMALKMLDINGRDKYHVVGFVTDEKRMHGRNVQGYKVLGDTEDIKELADMFRVDELLIAEPEMSAEEMRKIIRYCREANLRHRIVPAVQDLLSGSVHLSKFREVDISDLFGRKPVELDLTAIKQNLFGRKVMVTGAGGSIGSELCRQIAEFQPAYLLLIDKNENYLHEIQMEIKSQFPELALHTSLTTITNTEKMERIFAAFRPEVVFHAAAHKHVPLSEDNPEEAIWNNVFGTRNIADLADKYKVKNFVMVSTDKAVNPTSIMGVTKRIAELYVLSKGRVSETCFVTVRFGNVLNSNGSVIPIFRRQIEKGGPVTVTHPDVERYFMSISEAVQLILQAFTMGKNGEIFILEMGKSIRIMEMATELIIQAGFKPFDDIPIEVIGLRPGEKLFEELVGIHEESIPTSHASIKTLRSNYVYSIEEINSKINKLATADYNKPVCEIARLLKDIVPEYNYTPNDQPLTKTHSINVQVEAAQADGKKANPVTEASLSDFKNQSVTPEQKVK